MGNVVVLMEECDIVVQVPVECTLELKEPRFVLRDPNLNLYHTSFFHHPKLFYILFLGDLRDALSWMVIRILYQNHLPQEQT